MAVITFVVTSGVERFLWFAVRPTVWPLLRPSLANVSISLGFPPPGTDESFGSTEKVTVFAKIIVNSTKLIRDTASRGNNGCIDPPFPQAGHLVPISEMRGDTTTTTLPPAAHFLDILSKTNGRVW